MARPATSLLFASVGIGIGDMLWYTAGFPTLHQSGFVLDVVADTYTRPVLENNPHVRRLIPWEGLRCGDVPLVERVSDSWNVCWDGITTWIDAQQYGVSIVAGLPCDSPSAWNSVEERATHPRPLLALVRIGAGGTWQPREHPSDWRLVNYPDQALRVLGVAQTGLLPQLFPTFNESLWLSGFRRRTPRPLLLWHLGGSTLHKAMPQVPLYVRALLERCPALHVQFLGTDAQIESYEGILDRLLTSEQRARCLTPRGWSLRQQLLATSIADVVVGPESAVLNAAAAFDTPKVLFLSHSAHRNLSQWSLNVDPIAPDRRCPCSPCYHSAQLGCVVYADEIGTVPRPPRDEDRAPVGVKCCLYLDDREVIETIASILEGRRDRTCPACGAQRNRLIDGQLVCECGTVFAWRR